MVPVNKKFFCSKFGYIRLFLGELQPLNLQQIARKSPLIPKKTSLLFFLLFSLAELSEQHQRVMGILQSKLEQSHKDQMYDVTARLLVESAIRVETTRLQTEEDWRERLEGTKSQLEDRLAEMEETIEQVLLKE